MKPPKQPMLMSWYMKMLKGGNRGIVGFIGTERLADGGRVGNQRVENYIHEISYSEFFRNLIEDYLESGNFSMKNCIEKYSGKHGNQLFYVNFETAGEETIEYELTKTQNNWLHTLREMNLTFVMCEEAKKSTAAAILNMLMPENQ